MLPPQPDSGSSGCAPTTTTFILGTSSDGSPMRASPKDGTPIDNAPARPAERVSIFLLVILSKILSSGSPLDYFCKLLGLLPRCRRPAAHRLSRRTHTSARRRT